MPRWKGPGRYSTPGHYWRHVTCEFCGLKYKDFRITDEFPWVVNPWNEAKTELRLAREPPGSDDPPDPSKPVNRRSVLGRMFQYKQDAWKIHLRRCEEESMSQIYVNRATQEEAELLDVQETMGFTVYTLRLKSKDKNELWNEIHFKRCWKLKEEFDAEG